MASNIVVVPMPPTSAWQYVSHSEPVVTAGTFHVTFTNTYTPQTVNVMFADMAKMGNGDVDPNVVTPIPTPAPPAPEAQFSGDPLSGPPPLTVTFTDASTNLPATLPRSWTWDFGDGGSSTSQNPVHVYTDSGTYDVTLTVTNPVGTDSEVKSGYITVASPLTLTLRGTLSVGVDPFAICGAGNYVYIGSNGAGGAPSLYTVNVSDPDNPTTVDSLTIDVLGATDFSKMVISGNSIFATCWNTNAVYIIDITNPAAPTLRSYVESAAGTFGLSPDGAILYTCSRALPVIEVYDISDLNNPTYITGFSSEVSLAGYEGGLANIGTDALVISGTGDGLYPEPALRKFNLADPFTPVLSSTVNMEEYCRSFVTKNNYVMAAHVNWVGSQSILSLINLDTSAVATVAIEPGADGCNQIGIQGNYVFLPTINTTAGTCILYTVNVATPSAPAMGPTLALEPDCEGIYMGARYGYCISYSERKLIIFDTIAP